jgi:hypothetical protein
MNYNVEKDGAVVAVRLYVGENGLTPMADVKCYNRKQPYTVRWDVVADREQFTPGITAYTLWYDERPKRDFADW